MSWKTIRKYAEDHNISLSAVYQLANKNRLEVKKIKGIKMVNDSAESESQTAEKLDIQEQKENDQFHKQQLQRINLDNALKIEKLKNLKQDTILKKQKQKDTKEKYRLEYVQGVFECFTESFSNLKKLFIVLKLNKQQNQQLQKILKICIKDFEHRLKKYLAKKDQEQQQNEVSNIEE